MKKYDISISIVAYKNYEEILKAIYSIEKYTNKTIKKEFIVIDNSSDYIDKKANDNRFKLKLIKNLTLISSKENLGFGKAHNISLKKSNSKYIAIINPDIEFVEDSFDTIINYMDGHESVGAVIPKLIDKKNNIQNAYRRKLTIKDLIERYFNMGVFFKKSVYFHNMQDKNFSKPFKVPFAQGSFLVIRSDVLKKVGGFDDRYFMYMEDADLSRKINSISLVEYLPYTKVIHLWHKGSHRNFKLLIIHVKSAVKYFKKWGFK